MQSLFLSYSFKDDTDPLVLSTRAIIDAVGFRVVDGKILNNNQVGEGVKNKIKECFGTVCILTKNAYDTGWVEAEFWQAIGAEHKVCLIYDKNIILGNAYQGRAKVPVDIDDPIQVIEGLAGLIGMWKQETGHIARAIISPEDIGRDAMDSNSECKYQYVDSLTARESNWLPAKLMNYVAGVQAILPNVPPNTEIRIRIEHQNKIYASAYTPQHIALEVKNGN